MSQQNTEILFNADLAKNYDERNSNLSAITEAMHYLIQLSLKELPKQSKILCVGVGTGAEILSLAKQNPEFTFTGIDTSLPMLEVCKEKLEKADLLKRCELIHGKIEDFPHQQNFDAALSILVGHFINKMERADYYKHIINRLKSGGCFVNTELSYDLHSPQYPLMLENWKQVQIQMGAKKENLYKLSDQLKETLHILSWQDIEKILSQSGIHPPVHFFQAFLISGWYGIKP